MDKEKNPLWMPKGSVRGIAFLMVVITMCLGAIYGPVKPETMEKLAIMAFAFYFAQKGIGRGDK